MTPLAYRHAQTGWVVLASLLGTALVLGVVLVAVGLVVPAIVTVLVLVSLAGIFGRLTVTVSDREIAVWFGPGFPRRTIPLADVQTFRSVRNSWLHGWGIRFYGSGVLYNVSGLDAVEVILKDGAELRIGTDEPARLVGALESALGPSAPRNPVDEARAVRRRGRWAVIVTAAALLLGASLAGLLLGEARPPKATVADGELRVSSLVYSVRIPLEAVVQVDVAERLPRILLRTNGTGLGGTVRGHFRLDEWGDGHLFAELGSPPYVVVRTAEDFVVVSYDDPARTRALYATVHAAWREARPR